MNTSPVIDFLVIGAGMAGVSLAYELATHGRVLVLERESQPAYHATGRSAALYSQTYGPRLVRALSIGSADFFLSRANGLADHAVLTPRGVLFVGRPDQQSRLDQLYEAGRRWVDSVARLGVAEAVARVPVLRADRLAGAVAEPDASDLDVHGLHGAYMRGLRQRGGRVVTNGAVTGLTREGSGWRVTTRTNHFAAGIVVNAAGAWADEVADLVGLSRLGLAPRRRTALVFDPEVDDPCLLSEMSQWPMIVDADEEFYFKPEAGRLLASPADATPMAPCDVQPEDLDVAIAVDRIEAATRLRVRRIAHRWAGLRSFFRHGDPVAGFDPRSHGFFWLAGQGGYGIQTAPALARTAAAILTGSRIPDDLSANGIGASALSPDRLIA